MHFITFRIRRSPCGGARPSRLRSQSPFENSGSTKVFCFLVLSGGEEKRAWVIFGELGHSDLGGAVRLPRSLHYAARRTKTVRKKEPGRSGRDDGIFV